MKILSWIFSFLGKYHEFEENYEKSRNPFFRFILLTGTAVAPILLFWGASAIEKNSFGAILGFLLVLVLAILLLIKTPKDLFLLSLVAINHGIWILAERKKEKATKEGNLEDTNPKKKKRIVKWEKATSNPAWDFILGILGIVFTIASIALVFVWFVVPLAFE
ncbi:MAG: hypothetical protein IJY11_03580 [Clostridia bacterium]|nr:hypothetical protein [Clostridia bacterium]